jgi:hypothetical protein
MIIFNSILQLIHLLQSTIKNTRKIQKLKYFLTNAQ